MAARNCWRGRRQRLSGCLPNVGVRPWPRPQRPPAAVGQTLRAARRRGLHHLDLARLRCTERMLGREFGCRITRIPVAAAQKEPTAGAGIISSSTNALSSPGAPRLTVSLVGSYRPTAEHRGKSRRQAAPRRPEGVARPRAYAFPWPYSRGGMTSRLIASSEGLLPRDRSLLSPQIRREPRPSAHACGPYRPAPDY